MHITLHTSQGDINLELYPDKTPKTVTNFLVLAEEGYYDGLTFHRVIEEFMIQGGCPQWTGTWGPWYQFEDEFHPELRHNAPGKLSMANAWPGTNGSQFFITHTETSRLDQKHTVFWAVLNEEDQKTVDSIKQGDTIKKVTLHDDPNDLYEEMSEFVDAIKQAIKDL